MKYLRPVLSHRTAEKVLFFFVLVAIVAIVARDSTLTSVLISACEDFDELIPVGRKENWSTDAAVLEHERAKVESHTALDCSVRL